jgi:hypothetical protein
MIKSIIYRLTTASEESPILVTREWVGDGINFVAKFASTVKSQQAIARGDENIVGIFDRSRLERFKTLARTWGTTNGS